MLVVLSPTRVMVGPPEIVAGKTPWKEGEGRGLECVGEASGGEQGSRPYLSFQVTEEIAKLRDDKLTPVRDQVVGLDAVADTTAGI